MDSPFVIPLAAFLAVALLMAIISVVKLRDTEMDVQQELHREEMEHRHRMKELDLELERVKQGERT